MTGDDNVIDAALRPNGEADIMPLIIKYLAPFLVMTIISFFALCCFCCCSCCRKFPCFKCCRRNYEKKPVTKLELYIYLVLISACSVPLIIVSALGIKEAKDFVNSIGYLECTSISLVSDMNTGDTAANWMGLDKIATDLNLMVSDLNTKT